MAASIPHFQHPPNFLFFYHFVCAFSPPNGKHHWGQSLSYLYTSCILPSPLPSLHKCPPFQSISPFSLFSLTSYMWNFATAAMKLIQSLNTHRTMGNLEGKCINNYFLKQVLSFQVFLYSRWVVFCFGDFAQTGKGAKKREMFEVLWFSGRGYARGACTLSGHSLEGFTSANACGSSEGVC